MRRLSAVLLLPAVIITICMSGCAQPPEEAPELLDPVGIQVDTVAVSRSEISNVYLFEGSVVPLVDELAFSATGSVGSVYVTSGQVVLAGDVLMTLDQTALDEQMISLSEEMAFTEALLAKQTALNNVEIKIKQRGLDTLLGQPDEEGRDREIALLRNDIAQMRVASEQNERTVRLTQLEFMGDELKTLQDKRDACVLYAPRDGRIVFGPMKGKGDEVTAYEPVVWLADDTMLTVECGLVRERYLAEADDIYAMIGGGRYPLTHIPYEEGDPLHISRFSFADGAGPELSAGQYAVVCVIADYADDALIIPANALYTGAGNSYVYVMEDGARVQREVRTGVITDALAQIVSGLDEGDIVYVKN